METLAIIFIVCGWFAATVAAGCLMETAAKKLKKIKNELLCSRRQIKKGIT